MRLFGRHGFVGIKNPRDDFTRGHVARHNRHRVALGFLERLLAEVEAQLALAVRLILAVAAEAIVGEDGQDVPAEAHGLRRAGGQGKREEGAEQRGGLIHLGRILRRSRQI